VNNSIQYDSTGLISKKRVHLFLIWVVLILLTGSFEFSIQEDIQRYQDNILDLSTRTEMISATQSKGIFYILFVMPLYQIFGSVDLALLLVKFLIVTIFFIAFTLKAKNIKEAILFSVLLIIIPTFQEHYQEYLRQGLSIAVLFWSFSLKNIIPKLVLVSLSLVLHQVAIIPLSGVLLYRLINGRLDQVSNLFVTIFMIICSVSIALIFYLKTGSWHDSVSGILFLTGDRSNLFGYLYIFLYMIVLAYLFTSSPQAYMFSAFCIVCMFCALYPVILDFGRYLSVISLTHFFAISASYKKPIHLDIILASVFAIAPNVIF
jgi:hypothetical protein